MLTCLFNKQKHKKMKLENADNLGKILEPNNRSKKRLVNRFEIEKICEWTLNFYIQQIRTKPE